MLNLKVLVLIGVVFLSSCSSLALRTDQTEVDSSAAAAEITEPTGVPQEIVDYYLPDKEPAAYPVNPDAVTGTLQEEPVSRPLPPQTLLPAPSLPALPDHVKVSTVPPKNKTTVNSSQKTGITHTQVTSSTTRQPADNQKLKTSTSKSDKQKSNSSSSSAPTPTGKTNENPTNSATSEKTEKNQRLLARVGDELNIRLDKRGWIFLGYNNQIIKDGLPLTNREYGNNFTDFRFAVKKTGTYQLLFVYQDNSLGIQEKNLYNIEVVSPEEFNLAMAGRNDDEHTSLASAADGTSGEFINWLMQSGKYEEALTELLKSYEENSPDLNDQIANIYWRMKKPELALTYWLKNATHPLPAASSDRYNAYTDAYTEKAIAGIIKSAVHTNNNTLFLKYLNSLFTIKSFPVNEVLLMAAKYCQTKKDFSTAYDILNKWLTGNKYRDFMDEALFLLGKLHEESPEFKDYHKAREMYQRVFEEFPESFLARPAHERVTYLNRHYFLVR